MQTIENTREKDVTMVAPDDAEVEADDADDEFASEKPPIMSLFTVLYAIRCISACGQHEVPCDV